MVSTLELLDSLMQNGMKKSTAGRLEHSLSEKGIGGSGGFLDEVLKNSPSRSAAPASVGGTASAEGGIGDLLGSLLGGSSNLKTGALGAIAGAILGGGGNAIKGALSGGALAVLGSIALQAIRNTGEKAGAPVGLKLDSATKLTAGLRAPENDHEVQQLESVGQLIVKAMVNAAKADGRVDENELKRIMGNVEKDGVDPKAREFLAAELRKPMDTEGLVRGVTGPPVAAQVYAASLLAVELDTPQEQKYLSDLAGKLGLNADVVRRIHSAVGVA